MKWVQISSNSSHQVYELWDNEEKQLAFSYHVGHGTIRILSTEPRVFQLHKKGFLKNRIQLLNEYGIKMAALIEEGDPGSGQIEIDEKKLRFSIHNRLYKEAFIFSDESDKPSITCDLPATLNSYKVLLLVLCWYKMQHQKKESLQSA